MWERFTAEVEARLLRYCAIDTQSDDASPDSPSTPRQWDLLRLLAAELEAIGAAEITVAPYGAVLATIPATIPDDPPTVALLAHVDTSPAYPGAGVRPIVHRAWDGSDIVLPDDPTQVLRASDLPYLATRVGEDIVTASGTTLLGADDKAGIAVAMTLAAHLLAHPELPHGRVRVAFTSDEEISRGVHARLPADLGAAVAYTLDGGPAGEVNFENFNGDAAVVRVEGVSTHPSIAAGRLVNAIHLVARIVEALARVAPTPEASSGREGFIFVSDVRGTAAAAEIDLILRDFQEDRLAALGDRLRGVCAEVAASEPRARVRCEISPQYRNMLPDLEADMRPVELALEAIRRTGLQPHTASIRGGTDGAQLTAAGVPTPNLFTGQQEYHGPLEWVSVQDMARAVETCVHLLELWSREPAAPARAAPTSGSRR